MERHCPRLDALGIGFANSGILMNIKHTHENIKITDQRVIDVCLTCSDDCVYDKRKKDGDKKREGILS